MLLRMETDDNAMNKVDSYVRRFTMFAPNFDNIASSSFAVHWEGTANFSCLIIGPTSNLKTKKHMH